MGHSLYKYISKDVSIGTSIYVGMFNYLTNTPIPWSGVLREVVVQVSKVLEAMLSDVRLTARRQILHCSTALFRQSPRRIPFPPPSFAV